MWINTLVFFYILLSLLINLGEKTVSKSKFCLRSVVLLNWNKWAKESLFLKYLVILIEYEKKKKWNSLKNSSIFLTF